MADLANEERKVQEPGDPNKDAMDDASPRSKFDTVDASTRSCSNRMSLKRRRLFGREAQENLLLDAYRRRTTRIAVTAEQQLQQQPQEFVLITGVSGTGKTVLARSLERRVTAERGYFCWGKCDQIMHHHHHHQPTEVNFWKKNDQQQPFAPFQAAITQLVTTVLQNDDTGEEVIRLEEAMEEATKDNPDVSWMLLVRLFPVFEKMVQEMDESNHSQLSKAVQPPPNGSEANHATHTGTAETPAIVVFCKLLRAFCCVEHPVVLLLDDWQWLDSSSLEVLRTLGSMEAIPGLMIVGTCRGNEVSFQDPLAVLLRTMEEENNVRITDIQLSALSVDGVQEMVADLLELPADHDRAPLRVLAELIHQLTGGNPFFVQQNMSALREANFIYFADGSWQWNADAMSIEDHFEVARNRILDQAVQKLADSSEEMKETLIIASFLGAQFSLQHLNLVASPDSTTISLDALVQEGMLYKDSRKDYYRWTHDKFQRSAYSLVPKHEQESKSIQIGRRLLANLLPEEVEEHSFLISQLYLQGFELLVSPLERIQVAQLLLVAGVKAGTSSAFHHAAVLFSHGISLLPARPWHDQYDLCLALHDGAIEMEYCNGNFERSDELHETILQNARSLEDQLRAYEARIASLSARHMDKNALETGFRVLKKLGEPLPKRASLPYTLMNLAKIVMWLRKNSTESILAADTMHRWDKLAALRIFQMILPALMRSRGELSPIWAIRSVQITSKYGLSNMSAPIFLALGMILGTAISSLPEDSKRCSDIARQLEDRFQAPQWKCRMCIFGSYAKWWHEPFTSSRSLPTHEIGVKAGLISGDVELAYINSAFYCFYGFTTGISLQEYLSVTEEHHAQFFRLEQKTVFVELPIELAKLLQSDTAELPLITKQYGTYCDRRTKEAEVESGIIDPVLLIISYFCQLLLCVYTKDWAEGLRVWKYLQRLPIDAVYGPNWTVQIYFFVGTLEIMAAQATHKWIYKHRAAKRQLKLLKALEKNMTCPENILNKIHCLEAERHVLEGDQQKAKRKFQLSIKFAAQSGYLHDEALTHERLADAFSRWGDIEEANSSFLDAASKYKRWGCPAKTAACLSMIH